MIAVRLECSCRCSAPAAQLQSHQMVLMDMHTRVMDGMTASPGIRTLPNWESRPILTLPADAFVEDSQACIKAGMNDSNTKPVGIKTLYRVVLKWFFKPHDCKSCF